MDMGFPNLATGVLTGTFTMTFANGTLFGNLFEQGDFSAPPTAVPVTQTLEVTGGTGAFLWYNGTLTGGGTLNFTTGALSPSGSGTLNTTPEPGAIALLPIGLLCLVAYRKVATTKRRKSVGDSKDRLDINQQLAHYQFLGTTRHEPRTSSR
jgi:hypothetical protein